MPDRAGLSPTKHTVIDTVIDWERLLADATGQHTVPSGAAPAGPIIDASHLVEILVRASPAARAAIARGLADAVVSALRRGDIAAARAAARKLLEFIEQLPSAGSPMGVRTAHAGRQGA